MGLIVSPAGAERAPDWRLPDLDGGFIALAEADGEVVLIDFWASWCVPCRGSMAALTVLAEEFADAPVRILPISVDAEAEDARGFLRRYGPQLASAHDPDGVVAEAYGLIGMPTSFIVDGKGNVALRHEGFRKGDEDVWRKEIRRLLSAAQ